VTATSTTRDPAPSSTSSPAVATERRDAGLWLRLARPDTLNGLNQEILDGLHAGLDLAESDPTIRAVVLTGQGRAFCAGADLAYARSLAAEPVPDGGYSAGQLFLRRVRALLDRIEAFPRPVIAAVNGITVGGGLELLLCCDLALAARSARLGDGHAVYGQIPGGGASVRLPRRVGLARAKHMMFTGELRAAESYLDTDLLTDVVDDDALVGAVDALVATIATRSPVGLTRMKQLLHDARDAATEVALGHELEVSALHEHSQDWREGIDAFAEKRHPRFPGR
jgi:enoyl-CoA hydratase